MLFQDNFAGEKGFDALKSYIRDANDFCKEIGSIMQERADAENHYAKTLTKLGGKLNKAAGECLGSLREGWQAVAYEMNQEAEIHRQLSQALQDDITKAMKTLVEAHNKTRKTIEKPVDKAHSAMADKRGSEAKVKKNAHTVAKDREQAYDLLLTARQNAAGSQSKRSSSSSDKEVQKMEKKAQQAEDALRKVDREYINASQTSETYRQQWENTMSKAAGQLQSLEEERITQMKDFLGKYRNNMSMVETQLLQCCEKLKNLTFNLDIVSEIQTVASARGAGQHYAEQLLPDFYAEDNNNQMDIDRRRQTLQNYFIFLQHEADREKGTVGGLHHLLNTTHPETDTHKEARIRLINVTNSINYLEASLFKINCTLAALKGGEPQPYRYASFIQRNKEKGFMISKLMIPQSLSLESTTATSSPAPPSTAAASAAAAGPQPGGSPAPRRSSQQAAMSPQQGYPINLGITIHPQAGHGQDPQAYAYVQQSTSGAGVAPTHPHQAALPGGAAPTPYQAGGSQGYPAQVKGGVATPFATATHPQAGANDPPPSYQDVTRGQESDVMISHCRAVGDFQGQSSDELTFEEGDLITVYQKHDDGWWYGDANGRRGLFPAICVNEFTKQ